MSCNFQPLIGFTYENNVTLFTKALQCCHLHEDVRLCHPTRPHFRGGVTRAQNLSPGSEEFSSKLLHFKGITPQYVSTGCSGVIISVRSMPAYVTDNSDPNHVCCCYQIQITSPNQGGTEACGISVDLINLYDGSHINLSCHDISLEKGWTHTWDATSHTNLLTYNGDKSHALEPASTITFQMCVTPSLVSNLYYTTCLYGCKFNQSTNTWVMDIANKLCCEQGYAIIDGPCIFTTSAQNEAPKNGKNISITNGYPNPTNSNITFSYTLKKETDLRVIVYSTIGTQVGGAILATSKVGTNEVELSTSGLPTGDYLIDFEDNTESVLRRFTVYR